MVNYKYRYINNINIKHWKKKNVKYIKSAENVMKLNITCKVKSIVSILVYI